MNRLDTSGVGAVTVVVLGSAALLARPWLVHLPADPVWVLVALFVVLGLVGATWRLPDAAATPPGRRFVRPNRRESGEFGADHDDFGARIVSCGQIVVESEAITTPKDRVVSPATARTGPRPLGPLPAWLALGIGLGAFGVGRLLAVGTLPAAPLVVRTVALNTLAAVSEEAFFRRLAYGVASVWGPALAVVGSAVTFAAVHVTVWGWAVLPLDLAAGLVLGWQRWASGRWSVPAVTHVAANVLAVV